MNNLPAETALRELVRSTIQDEFGHVLEDISFRIGQAHAVEGREPGQRGKVFAEDLRIKDRVFMTGYVVSNNSPAAGSIAWTDMHMVYDGTDYTIANGNTANKYVWWSPTTTPTAFQTGSSKPNLGPGEVLVLLNNAGIHKVMLSDTNQSLPGVVADGAVDKGSILANAVGSAALEDGAVGQAALGANAVTSGKIADGAVQRAGILAANVVTHAAVAVNAIDDTNLTANSVTLAKVADGAVARAGQLGANVVTGAKVADGAIARAAQMSANVVTNTQIAANAVNSASLADGAVTRQTQLGANVVASGALVAGAVTDTKLANGAVGAGKLNILRHVMY